MKRAHYILRAIQNETRVTTRFWQQVSRPEAEAECWGWRGKLRKRLPSLGVGNHSVPAVRIAWWIRTGSFPVGGSRAALHRPGASAASRSGMTARSGATNETARIEAFSDGVFAIAITLLILGVRVPPQLSHESLSQALPALWPSYLAFVASFMTIGIMWLNHHRLFTLIHKAEDGLITLNLLLLLGITWLPFPTSLLAEHLQGPHADQRIAALLYATSFLAIGVILNGMWRYAIAMRLVGDDEKVPAITRQLARSPMMYLGLVGVALISADWCLVLSAAYAVYFALPPRLWSATSRADETETAHLGLRGERVSIRSHDTG